MLSYYRNRVKEFGNLQGRQQTRELVNLRESGFTFEVLAMVFAGFAFSIGAVIVMDETLSVSILLGVLIALCCMLTLIIGMIGLWHGIWYQLLLRHWSGFQPGVIPWVPPEGAEGAGPPKR